MVYFQIKYKAIKIIKKELCNSSTLFVDFVCACVCVAKENKPLQSISVLNLGESPSHYSQFVIFSKEEAGDNGMMTVP